MRCGAVLIGVGLKGAAVRRAQGTQGPQEGAVATD